MADSKLSALPALSAAPATGDLVYLVDISEPVAADRSKQITVANLLAGDFPITVDASISASALKGTVTTGAGDANLLPQQAETTTNKVNYDYMAFTVNQQAYFQYRMPVGWNEGTITFRYLWTATAGSGNVTLGLKAIALSDNDALDTAFGTQVTVQDTLQTANAVHVSAASGAVTVGGTPAAQDMTFFQVTLTAIATTDFRLLGLVLSFTRDAATD